MVINNQNKKETIKLLDDINGFIKPGEMTALTGPSGSGKSTLLDVLSMRKTVGTLEGDIKFAGNKPSKMFIRRFTGYVEQFDTLLGTLTVEEMLMYTAQLKREMSEPWGEKQEAVDELLEVMALQSCRSVLIGNPMARGISGGQAKRVNIGIALISQPNVLFLDEPTSGLDSYTANEVMSVVRSLANYGITVCATVHSPTSYVFNLFDRSMMLLKGKVVYFGENGGQVLDYFQNQCPTVEGLKEGENPAEWIVDLTTLADRQGKADEFATAFAKSPFKEACDREIEEIVKESSNALDDATIRDLAVTRETVTPFWHALITLLKYRTLKNYKDGAYLGPRLGDKLLLTFIIFTLYWGIGDDLSNSNIPNLAAVLFMWCTLPAYGAAAYVPSIIAERPVFIRERNDGLYRVITYLTAKIIDELGVAFVASIVFSNVVFWVVNLQGSWPLFWLVYLATLSCGIVLAYFVAAISPNMDVANAALPAYVTMLLFFAGLLLRWSQIPWYWRWFGYIDFLRYSWGALMVNQFGGANNVPYLGYPGVLEYYSLGDVNMWGFFGIIFAFFAFFFFAAYLALRYIKHVKR